MRIAIVAPGGVGGYFGGLLAVAGEEVVAVARGAHLEAINAQGLRIEGARGNHVAQIVASDSAASLGIADIVLFAVKLFQAEAAARAAAPLFGPGTLAISLLNGIDGPEKLAGGLRGSPVLGGSAYVSAVIAEPGLVRYTSGMSSIVFGAPQGNDAARAKAADFVERCRKAGFSAETTDDIQSSLWSKFIGLAANAALTSAARLPAGPLYSDPDVIEAAAALIAEGTAVARAAGQGPGRYRGGKRAAPETVSAGHVCLDVSRHRQGRSARGRRPVGLHRARGTKAGRADAASRGPLCRAEAASRGDAEGRMR